MTQFAAVQGCVPNGIYRPVLGILLVLAPMLNSCFLAPKITAPNRTKRPSSQDVFSEGNFSIERSLDGLSAAVRFETLFSASCEIAYVVQSSESIDNAKLNWQPCRSSQPGRIFDESITGLDPAKLYTVAVNIWSATQQKDQGTIYKVNELSSPADPDTSYVLRVDLKTLSGSFEGLKLKSPINQTVEALQTPKSCSFSEKPSTAEPLGTPTEKLVLTRISSRGFFSGATDPVVQTGNYRPFVGSSLQKTNQDWLINMQTSGASGTLRPAKPPILESVLIKQGSSSLSISDFVLQDEESMVTTLAQSSDLNISWTALESTDKSIIYISITNSVSGQGVICRVKSAGLSSSTVVPSDLLKKLPKGGGFITISLETPQALESKRWIVITNDWKSGPIRF